jgi:hypothetical protein
MTTYLPALIWAISAFVCLYIAKRRHLKQTALRSMAVALAGPFAIPFVLAAKRQLFTQA